MTHTAVTQTATNQTPTTFRGPARPRMGAAAGAGRRRSREGRREGEKTEEAGGGERRLGGDPAVVWEGTGVDGASEGAASGAKLGFFFFKQKTAYEVTV